MIRLVVLVAAMLVGCAREEPRDGPVPTEIQHRLRAALSTGDGDPVGDARRAAQRGDFRLFWNFDHWGGATVIGLHCRIPAEADSERLLLLSTTTGTNSPRCGSLGEENLCTLEDRLRRYMPTYNRTVLASPAFPYPDLCVSEDATQGVHPPLHDPSRFPAERPAITDNPRDLGEAARRGSRASLEGLMRGMSAVRLSRPDLLGLSPLAWAVIMRRRDVAELLLAGGADPLMQARPVGSGETLRANEGANAMPLVIALRSGQDALTDRMITAEVRQRLQPWPDVILAAAEQGGNRRLAELIRRERAQADRMRALQERERAAQRTAGQASEEARSIRSTLLDN